MKALSMVVVLSGIIVVAGCGADSSTCPDGQVENEQGECVDVPECWGDNDCPTQHACIDFKCVLHPECAVDEDCSTDGSLICNEEYLCVSYLAQDACVGRSCNGECISCGSLTYCYENKCENACDIYYEMYADSLDIGCFELSGVCPVCTCWNNNHQDLDPYGSGSCIPHINPTCNTSRTTYLKVQIEETDWNKLVEDTRNHCLF